MANPPVKRSLAAVVGTAAASLLFQYTPIFEGTALKPYRDPIGIWTYCTGETKNVDRNRTYTPAECRAQLETSLVEHANGVSACVMAPLTDGQRAAAISFAYNVGVAKFCGSTMARKFNERQYAAGCAEFSKWVYAGGRVLPGLVKRRATERAICEGRVA